MPTVFDNIGTPFLENDSGNGLKDAYDTLSRASLQLVPPADRIPEWRADYEAMKAMFFNDPPTFGKILTSLEEIQSSLSDGNKL